MPTAVDICNLALSHLGDEAEVTSLARSSGGDYQSSQAQHCARFYPMARDALLEAHPWPFATKRVALEAADANDLEADWSYAYELPDDCLRPLAMLVPGAAERPLSNEGTDAGSFTYLVETNEDGDQILYTDVDGASLRFIERITDTSVFSPGFVIALSHLLASYLAGPVIKGAPGMKVSQAQLQLFDVAFRKAAAHVSNIGHRAAYRDFQPSHIAERGLALYGNTTAPSA